MESNMRDEPEDRNKIVNDDVDDDDVILEDGQEPKRKKVIVGVITVICVALVGGGTSVGLTLGLRSNPHATGQVLGFNLEQDNIDIHKMHDYASNRQWSKVWPMLDRKPYLINVIPENVTTALLHIAALFYDSFSAVDRLLHYSSCDVLIKTTEFNVAKIPAGQTAEDLAKTEAKKYPTTTVQWNYYTSVAKLLDSYRLGQRKKRFSDTVPYFVTQKQGEIYNKKGLPLMLISLSAYKKAFLEPDDLKLSPRIGFQDLLKKIFNSITTTWIEAKHQVTSALYGFDAGAAGDIDNKGITEYLFYKYILWLYTSDHVYLAVNLALRRQANLTNGDYNNYKPAGDDILLGPYILMLDAVVTYWKELTVYNQTTYRGVKVSVADEYKVNSKIVFLTYLSSSSDPTEARAFGDKTIFVIDNSMKTPWQPRSIDDNSKYRNEDEKLYAPGAEFLVTKVTQNMVYLKLIQAGY